MIVVDTSALIAIFDGEPDAELYVDALRGASSVSMSAFTMHETGTVIVSRHGNIGLEKMLNFLLPELGVNVVPFDEQQARFAITAYGRYGRGLGSKAKLNLADCASYALAKSLNRPLLFKGNDFIHTDVQRCL